MLGFAQRQHHWHNGTVFAGPVAPRLKRSSGREYPVHTHAPAERYSEPVVAWYTTNQWEGNPSRGDQSDRVRCQTEHRLLKCPGGAACHAVFGARNAE